MKLNILCLYYDIMNLYGDTGNLKVLKYHLEELNIPYQIDKLTLEDKLNFSKYDLILIGAGTEENRLLALKHLKKYQKSLKTAIEKGKFFLITGNALPMFGKKLYNEEALNIFDFSTKETKERVSKEVIINNDIGHPIYGFVNNQDDISNHQNYLFENEGIKYKNFYGTQVLGPILSRNPDFLKYFLKELLQNTKYQDKIDKINNLNTALNDKAYQEFIAFKKTKKFNANWA